MRDAATNVGSGHVQFANGAEESGDVLVKNLLRAGGRRGVVLDINAAAMPKFGPAIARELAVSGADGVGMNAEASGEFAGAGEAVAGAEISCEDGKNHLRDKLPVDGHFAGRREPESHGVIVAGNDEAGIRD